MRFREVTWGRSQNLTDALNLSTPEPPRPVELLYKVLRLIFNYVSILAL